jgi:uncharacterized lipoprotein YmbA
MTSSGLHLALAGLLAALLLTGCSSSAPRVTYYSLYAPAQQPLPAKAPAPTPLVVSVGPVTIPDILKQAPIATGGADGRYQLSEHHRWSGELDRDMARAVAEQLAGNLGTEQVAIFPWDQQFKPTCRVLLDVLSMGGERGAEATLQVRWALVDPAGEVALLVRRSDLRAVPAQPGYAAWVAAQQRNIVTLGQEIAAAITLRAGR